MKVILVKDVARLGRKGEVKDVPDGHALNMLIPRKFAIIATPESMKRISEEHKKHAEHKQSEETQFKEALERLAQSSLSYKADANDKGNLFKGINGDDIVKRLAEEKITVSKSTVVLPHPIKELGTHTIVLRQGGVEGVCTLEVIKK